MNQSGNQNQAIPQISTEQSPIASACDDLNSALNHTYELIALLEKKLEPVLSLDGQPPLENGESNCAPCPLYSVLMDRLRTIESINYKLVDLRDRVQL